MHARSQCVSKISIPRLSVHLFPYYFQITLSILLLVTATMNTILTTKNTKLNETLTGMQEKVYRKLLDIDQVDSLHQRGEVYHEKKEKESKKSGNRY